jgi:hypothetical protein
VTYAFSCHGTHPPPSRTPPASAQIYEYLLSRGADPSVLSEDYDPYLSPGAKLPLDMAVEEGPTRQLLRDLETKYQGVKKVWIVCMGRSDSSLPPVIRQYRPHPIVR